LEILIDLLDEALSLVKDINLDLLDEDLAGPPRFDHYGRSNNHRHSNGDRPAGGASAAASQ